MSTYTLQWRSFLFSVVLLLPVTLCAQHTAVHSRHSALADIESQPLLSQALRLQEALSFLGSALSPTDINKLKSLEHQKPGPEVTKSIQEILDPYCLNIVSINPEARVKVDRGLASASLIQGAGQVFY